MDAADKKTLAGAALFALAGIVADGLSTAVALSAGGHEGNPLMRNDFGGIVWANFAIVRGLFFAAMAGGAGLLWQLTRNRILTALPFVMAGVGDFHVAAQNLLVAMKLKGWL